MSERPRSTRRDFLRGKAAADALAARVLGPEDAALTKPGDVAKASGAAKSAAADEGEASGYVLRISRRAMACEFEIVLNLRQYPQGTEAAMAALDLIDQLEDQLSIYRPESEISQLNRTAFAGPVPVESRLADLLKLALRIHAATGGAYDITSGPLSRVWGFTRREGRLPTSEEIDAARASVGSQHLQFDALGRLGCDLPGVDINLASIGKGYALDRAQEVLRAFGVRDCILHGGSSSVLARGASMAETGGGWLVGVRDPLRGKRIGCLRLCDRALSTSNSGGQYFLHEGRRYGHLLDPRSGWPADAIVSATVLAPTAAEAEALSTAFFVLGVDGARDYCATHAEIGCLLLVHSMQVDEQAPLVAHPFNLAGGVWLPGLT